MARPFAVPEVIRAKPWGGWASPIRPCAKSSFATASIPAPRPSEIRSAASLAHTRWQRAHADFLEPNDVARIMILQADVPDLRTLRFAFRFMPDLSWRHICVCRIEARDAFSVQIDENLGSRER